MIVCIKRFAATVRAGSFLQCWPISNEGFVETVVGIVGTVLGTVVETDVNYIGTVRFLS